MTARASVGGIALVEVLVALVVVTAVGVPLLGRVAAEAQLLVQRSELETLIREAEGVLTEYATMDRTELEQRLGRRGVGELQAVLDRPQPTLFRVAVVHPDAPDRELLVTFLHRQAP